MTAPWVERARARSRRPVKAVETPQLEALGAAVRAAREGAGLSRAALAATAQVHPTWLTYIEHGAYRTRRSTLTRIAAGIVTAQPNLGPIDLLVEHWCGLAGPALAPESRYTSRRRRMARGEQQQQREV